MRTMFLFENAGGMPKVERFQTTLFEIVAGQLGAAGDGGSRGLLQTTGFFWTRVRRRLNLVVTSIFRCRVLLGFWLPRCAALRLVGGRTR